MTGVTGLAKQALLVPAALRPKHIKFPYPPVDLASIVQRGLIGAQHGVDTTLSAGRQAPEGFYILPQFFQHRFQATLLSAALERLERIAPPPRERRKRRNKAEIQARKDDLAIQGHGLEGWFRPNEEYKFEESHTDKVIRFYRKALLTSPLAPPSGHRDFAPNPAELLGRLDFLFPQEAARESLDPDLARKGGPRVQTHVLHLARDGWIGPQVDGKTAMGDILVSICLGGSRVLRLEHEHAQEGEGRIDVLLESGTVYVQMGEARNEWKHSILPPRGSVDYLSLEDKPVFDVDSGQRLSIILRDLPAESTELANITDDPLSPAYYNPRHPLPPSHAPLSSADALYTTLSPLQAFHAEQELRDDLNPRFEQYETVKGSTQKRYEARTRDGSDIDGRQRIEASMKARKWGGK